MYRDFELNAKGSQLVATMEAVLSGSRDMDKELVLRSIHDNLFGGSNIIQSGDVMVLGFLVLQVRLRIYICDGLSSRYLIRAGGVKIACEVLHHND